jgi:hypothetical protein
VGWHAVGVQRRVRSYASALRGAAHSATLQMREQSQDRLFCDCVGRGALRPFLSAVAESLWSRVGQVVSTTRPLEPVVLCPELRGRTAQCAPAVHRTTRLCLLAERLLRSLPPTQWRRGHARLARLRRRRAVRPFTPSQGCGLWLEHCERALVAISHPELMLQLPFLNAGQIRHSSIPTRCYVPR